MAGAPTVEVAKEKQADAEPFSWPTEAARAKKIWGPHPNQPLAPLSLETILPPEQDSALYAKEILEALKPFLMFLHECRGIIKGGLSGAMNNFGECIKPTDPAVIALKQVLGVGDLVVAGIKVDVPLCLLREYNAMEENDPRLPFYRSHPIFGFEFVDFGAFLDRFDTLKGVVCFLVYSSWDSACIAVPIVTLHPYPLCWRCNHFGEMKCSSCLVARYCSKACQEQDWRLHKLACTALHGLKDRHVAYRF